MKGKWHHLDLGLTDYQRAHDLQLQIVEAKKEGVLKEDVVLFLEHPSVFTLGRRGGVNNLKVPEAFVESQGIPIIHVERGGDITYHGPGQLVVYPIVDLRAAQWKVTEFVEALEEVMIRTVAEWGIRAERNPLNRGAWVGLSKIGSIGIAVRRSISFHGFALNVNTEIEPFSWVHPCGLQGVLVTTMKQLLEKEIDMEDVRRAAGGHIQKIFGVRLVAATIKDIRNIQGNEPRTPGRKAG